MALIISDSVVLARFSETDTSSYGLLAYESTVTVNTITANSSGISGQASNMANYATWNSWTSAVAGDHTITINNSEAPVDYIGIARHNLNQSGLTMRVRFDGVTVLGYTSVSSQQALMLLFEEASPTIITIDIQGSLEPVSIAVLYAGKALMMQRGIYVGHTPITYGRDRKTINGVSESGQYLGEVVVSSSSSTNVSLSNLTPDWYRQSLDPFFAQLPRKPAFWAWKPEKYPAEVGYVWIKGNPRPENSLSNGMMSISFDLTGIA